MWLRVSSMSAWSHLPNAKHIDRVLASVKEHPETWDASWNVAYDAALDAVFDAAYNAADDAAWSAARDEAYGAARAEAYGAAQGAAWCATWNAILALIAYDDCEQYLSMTSEELRAWAMRTEHPAAILLLPMVIVREQIEQLESV